MIDWKVCKCGEEYTGAHPICPDCYKKAEDLKKLDKSNIKPKKWQDFDEIIQE